MSGSLPCFSHISASHNLGPLRICLLIFLCRSINTLMPSNLMTLGLTDHRSRSNNGSYSWHLSVQQRAPKLWQGQARPDQLDDAAESSGEPGGSASGDFSGLIGGTFFSLGVG